jgi:hypothetical protein
VDSLYDFSDFQIRLFRISGREKFSEFVAGKGNSGKEKEILKRNSEKKFWQGGGPGVGD